MQNINLWQKSGKTAKSKINIELLDKTKITVIGYNQIADECYQKIKKDTKIFIYGRINSKMEIEIQYII